eukprot:7078806-Prymnesium_polylepis.1
MHKHQTQPKRPKAQNLQSFHQRSHSQTSRLASRVEPMPRCAVMLAAFGLAEASVSMTTIATGIPSDRGYKYAGAVAVGDYICFIPHLEADVGVLDTTNSNFSLVPTGQKGFTKYSGGVAIDDTVYFAPYGLDTVGVFNTTTMSFSTIDAPGAEEGAVLRYIGAAEVDGKVYFG